MVKPEKFVQIGIFRLWQSIKWLWRAWPFIMVLLLACIHQIALAGFPANRLCIHKLTGTAMQVTGGLVVLYSVNDNLGLFRQKSLLLVFKDWFRDFPMFRRPITFSGNVSVQGNSAVTGVGSIKRNPVTLEERIGELELELTRVREDILTKEAALNNRIDEVKDEMSQAMTKHQTEILQISDNLERTAVGGFKLQGFGVLLALYGAGINALA